MWRLQHTNGWLHLEKSLVGFLPNSFLFFYISGCDSLGWWDCCPVFHWGFYKFEIQQCVIQSWENFFLRMFSSSFNISSKSGPVIFWWLPVKCLSYYFKKILSEKTKTLLKCKECNIRQGNSSKERQNSTPVTEHREKKPRSETSQHEKNIFFSYNRIKVIL